jgi:hypothetical protein
LHLQTVLQATPFSAISTKQRRDSAKASAENFNG